MAAQLSIFCTYFAFTMICKTRATTGQMRHDVSRTHNNDMSSKWIINEPIGLGASNALASSIRDEKDHGVSIRPIDKVTELVLIVRSMQMMKIAQLELEVKRLEMPRPTERSRTCAAWSNPDALRRTNSPVFSNSVAGRAKSKEDDAASLSNISRTKSELMTPMVNMCTTTYTERPTNAVLFSVSTGFIFRTSSATANKGYDNKMVLWGTIFTSLTVACRREYIPFTNVTAHVVHEVFLMKTSDRIVSELDHSIKYTDLPAVRSRDDLFMSKTFTWRDSNDVPVSNANNLWSIQKHTDGTSTMAVIETISTAEKMVPEAL